MGQVYRAHDARLRRDVAIKVLPADRLADAAAIARMVRESRLVAALEHPSIITIHDVGEEDGQFYLVTELIEGETLARQVAAWRAAASRSARVRDVDCGGAWRRPCSRRRASRSQTRERDDHRHWHGKGSRLWRGEVRGAGRFAHRSGADGDDEPGRNRRHTRIYGAGAARRARHRSPGRSVRLWSAGLRDAHRCASVRRRDDG